MKGCAGTGNYSILGDRLESILSNMTAHCPESCDLAAAYNCSVTYYDRVVTSFISGIDCPVLGRCVEFLGIVVSKKFGLALRLYAKEGYPSP